MNENKQNNKILKTLSVFKGLFTPIVRVKNTLRNLSYLKAINQESSDYCNKQSFKLLIALLVMLTPFLVITSLNYLVASESNFYLENYRDYLSEFLRNNSLKSILMEGNFIFPASADLIAIKGSLKLLAIELLSLVSIYLLGLYLNYIDIFKETKLLKEQLIQAGLEKEIESDTFLNTPYGILIRLKATTLKNVTENEVFWKNIDKTPGIAKEHPKDNSIIAINSGFKLKKVYDYRY
ncbi:MAG: hypothetical protein GY909_15240 [Oligoflexia bacterium]|nr:hypothetical protein [Oligoflexia bacterium]